MFSKVKKGFGLLAASALLAAVALPTPQASAGTPILTAEITKVVAVGSGATKCWIKSSDEANCFTSGVQVAVHVVVAAYAQDTAPENTPASRYEYKWNPLDAGTGETCSSSGALWYSGQKTALVVTSNASGQGTGGACVKATDQYGNYATDTVKVNFIYLPIYR